MLRILEEALTFDDVLLVPAYSQVLPHEVGLGTQLTRGIRLNLPVVSAAMDTVTEHRLAISIAQEGGIGIVHKNMTVEVENESTPFCPRSPHGAAKINAYWTTCNCPEAYRLFATNGILFNHESPVGARPS
jgi:IMP dehydrogenase